MKNYVSKVIFGLLVGLLTSCVSLQDREMDANDRASAQVIGSVEVKFTSFQWFHIPIKTYLKQKAYTELKKAAQKQYAGNNIDIKNITIKGRGSGWQAVYMGSGAAIAGGLSLISLIGIGSFYEASPYVIGVSLIGNFQKITATGDVVSIDTRKTATGVEGALARAAQDVLKNVPARSRIAIVYITAGSETEYIAGELEYIWVNDGFTIIDRSQLDRIRREQNFQMSGEVDDDTAVFVGKMIGANIIVTGRVDGEGRLRRLRLRALNTQTAQVVGAASERL